MFVASISSSVSLSGMLFTGENAARVWFILSVLSSACPVSPLIWQFSGFNVRVLLCLEDFFLSQLEK